MTAVADVVQLSKLETRLNSRPDHTLHVRYVPVSAHNRRMVRKEEVWKREGKLGIGNFGVVLLARCVEGERKGESRAVKKAGKLESYNYHRELHAITFFSHSTWEHCFVKSYGWYDSDDSIFVTIEYLKEGDLQSHIRSALPEQEGKLIVSQILEALQFMHDNGCTHRDLKPANILIVTRGPDWWVKLADFAISKRALEGLTALRTVAGTPAFMAPEILGFVELDDSSTDDGYTNAVDIWSLGVIAYFLLTGEIIFNDQRRLVQYAMGRSKFPLDALNSRQLSIHGIGFVRTLMAPSPKNRPAVKECLQDPWLNHSANSSINNPKLLEIVEGAIRRVILPEMTALKHEREIQTNREELSKSLRDTNISGPQQKLSEYTEPEATAKWETRDQDQNSDSSRADSARWESRVQDQNSGSSPANSAKQETQDQDRKLDSDLANSTIVPRQKAPLRKVSPPTKPKKRVPKVRISVPNPKPERVAECVDLFYKYKPKDGYISGTVGADIFNGSGLSYEILGQVWHLSDTKNMGKLGIVEFAVAMYLLLSYKAKLIPELPWKLPEEFYSCVRFHCSRAVTARAEDNWTMSTSQRLRYQRRFANLDRPGRGYVTGEQVSGCFSQSPLSDDELADILSLIDGETEGRLTSDEFAVTCYLVDRQEDGRKGPLPASLPAEFRALPTLTQANLAEPDQTWLYER